MSSTNNHRQESVLSTAYSSPFFCYIFGRPNAMIVEEENKLSCLEAQDIIQYEENIIQSHGESSVHAHVVTDSLFSKVFFFKIVAFSLAVIQPS